MEKKNIILWGSIVVLAIGVIWSLNRTGVIGPIGPRGPLGSVVGPDFPNPNCTEGLCTYVASATFVDSTTTPVSIDINNLPFSPATATVSLIQLVQKGNATTSFRFVCGTDTNPSMPRIGVNRPTNMFFTSPYIATSTNWDQMMQAGPTTTPTYLSRITNRYFLCGVRGTGDTDALGTDGGWDNAFTNNSNTFDGRFKVRFNYSSQ